MKILFVQSGGTIDKSYAEFARSKTYSFDINEPAFKSILEGIKKSGLAFKYRMESVVKKDSLDMDINDRLKLKDACISAAETKIVITHGTDTMVKTAEVLSDIKGKTIVLTGATFPEKQKNSDAWFNVGLAAGCVQCLPEGVYIAMSGCIYNWNEVEKNQGTGVFEKKHKN